MRSAIGETSTSLSVGIFSAESVPISMPSTPCWVPVASFARSAWLVDAERATEKNRNTGTVSCGRPSSRRRRGRYRAVVHALPCRTCPWRGSGPARGKREWTARCWCARHAVAFPGLYEVASASPLLFLFKVHKLLAFRRAAGCSLRVGDSRGRAYRCQRISGLRAAQRGSLDDLAKTGVVIAGVVAGVRNPGLAATHNAPGSPVARSWCSDGVLTVVAPLVCGQQPLAIAKNCSVLVIRKGPSFTDQRIRRPPLGRQLGQCDRGDGAVGGRGVPGMPRYRGQHERNTQNTQKPCFARPGGYSLQHQRTFQKLRVNPKFRAASVAQRPPKSKRLHKDWADAEGKSKLFKLALAINFWLILTRWHRPR